MPSRKNRNKKNQKKKKREAATLWKSFTEQADLDAVTSKLRVLQRYGTLNSLEDDVRKKLRQHGTDVNKNDADPTGDGDQSPLPSSNKGLKAFYRDLYITGADVSHMLGKKILSAGKKSVFRTFTVACIEGKVDFVKQQLHIYAHYRGGGKHGQNNSTELQNFLERRESSLRYTPLLWIVAIGKTLQPKNEKKESALELEKNQLEVVKLLLQYGARPDARDVIGKTVCHYGMGKTATHMTLKAVDMCIAAFECSHYFHKPIMLCGLQSTREMNGHRGIVRGFDADSGRLIVLVPGGTKLICAKPENVRLLGCGKKGTAAKKLCDIPDRFGSVCLHELLLSDRGDVAEHLLKKHNASIDVADSNGYSPRQVALMPACRNLGEVNRAIVAHASDEEKDNVTTGGNGAVQSESSEISSATNRAESPELADFAGRDKTTGQVSSGPEATCSFCGCPGEGLMMCGGCKKVQYCDKNCQGKDWKLGHKQICLKMRRTQFEMRVSQEF